VTTPTTPTAEVTDLFVGDCLDILKGYPDNHFDSVVTDPPYGLSIMRSRWDYDVPSEDTWRECLRVLKPGGHLLAFAGTRTQHRMGVRIEDAGFEIRDILMWAHSQGFPKSLDVGKAIKKVAGAERAKQWDGWGTALKPALEPITMARKVLTKGTTVAANVLEWGTGGINIDACRVPASEALVRPSIDRQDNAVLGKGLGAGVQVEPSGRWPSNFTHDGSDEVLGLFPESKSTKGNGKSKINTFVAGGPVWNDSNTYADSGSAARFFYCAKASKSERGEGNTHSTVKPIALMRYLCRLVTPPGGLVLDPFMGSGTTGCAAVAEGFRFVGIDLSAEYVEIARKRIQA
jgi:site-specific DNA-methyltransferase (adenine-specific)